MALLERVGPEALSREFARVLRAAALEAAADGRPRIGIEQEHYVRCGGATLDFRDYESRLDSLGVRVHPVERSVRITPRGIALLADYDVAETASPPTRLGHGCAAALQAWAREGAALLASTLDDGCVLDGASTHFSVETSAAINDRLCFAYTATYAPGLMLLLDRAASPGLLVRPRPSRTELCGEFAVGAQLRAAAMYAAGSVLAAARDLVVDGWTGPTPLRVTVEPARRRFGWYVSRHAFGGDLYADGRAATLHRSNGGTATAQIYLEWGWSRARDALGSLVSTRDLADADAVVAGRLPLPLEHVMDDDAKVPAPAAAALGRATRVRRRDLFDVRLHTATWDVAMFQIDRRGDKAMLVVPHETLDAFLSLLDRGELDAFVAAYLEERTLDAPRIVTRASDTDDPGLYDAVRRSPGLLPDDRMGVGPGEVDPLRPGKRVVPGRIPVGPPPGEVPEPPGEDRDRRIPFLAIFIALITIVGIVTVIVGRGDDTTTQTVATTTTQPASPATSISPSTTPTTTGTSTLVPVAFEVHFVQSEFATHYLVHAFDNEGLPIETTWALAPPPNDPTCNNHGVLTGSGPEFVWVHAEGRDGCDHTKEGPLGHDGTVSVTVTDGQWVCRASYSGTQGPNGDPNASVDFGPCAPASAGG